MRRSTLALLVIFLVLLIDQLLKIYIKTSMQLGEEFGILGFSWARIHFTENEGMAFGMKLGGNYGKLLLTLFRIIAVGFIGYYLVSLIRHKTSKGLIASIALIFAGALGNIIDSIFYGVIFNDSFYQVATLFPEEGGYAPVFYGHVVDMFYFPMLKGYYPEWLPFIGGDFFLFFRPVFNIADSAITLGVLSVLLFQRSIFAHHPEQEATQPGTESHENVTPEAPHPEKQSSEPESQP